MKIGDHVTIKQDATDSDVEISVHSHVVIVAVEPGPRYVVAHPPVPRRFGPYPEDRLMPGWVAVR